jgi:hypothetical protein
MKLQEWAHFAEITASIAVVVSLIFLTMEVGKNTRVMERQSLRDRSAALSAPFFDTSRLPTILTKIKAVDGIESLEQAYIDRYNLTHDEAGIWTRYQAVLWSRLEADFVADGATPALEAYIKALLSYPDVELSWKARWGVSDAKFIEYVERLQEEL